MKLKAKTPEGAAREFARYLKKKYPEDTDNLLVRNNEVIWEEGPHDWTMVTLGTSILGPELGGYGDPDPDFPEGLENGHVMAEAINHYSISFHKN